MTAGSRQGWCWAAEVPGGNASPKRSRWAFLETVGKKSLAQKTPSNVLFVDRLTVRGLRPRSITGTQVAVTGAEVGRGTHSRAVPKGFPFTGPSVRGGHDAHQRHLCHGIQQLKNEGGPQKGRPVGLRASVLGAFLVQTSSVLPFSPKALHFVMGHKHQNIHLATGFPEDVFELWKR